MKRFLLSALLLVFLSAAVFAQKIDTKLIYGSWETQNGTTKGFLTFDQKGAYYYAISDNTKGVDTMLEGTFTFEDDKGLTVLVMNQQKVHKKNGSTNEKATIKYTVVILTEKDLAMGRIGSSGFTEFTRAGYAAAPAKAVPAAVKTPGIPSAEFDLFIGCLENNIERVKYAIERGIDNEKLEENWFDKLPQEESLIIMRNILFWYLNLSKKEQYKNFLGEFSPAKIEDYFITGFFDVDMKGWPIILIPMYNDNPEILKLLLDTGVFKKYLKVISEFYGTPIQNESIKKIINSYIEN